MIQNIYSWRLWIWKNKLITQLISHQPNIDKIDLYAKDPFKAKYQLKHLNDCKAFINYLNGMDNIYNSIEEYSPNKECKILIVDILSNKKLNPRVTELFIGGRKCVYLVFITQSYFAVPKMLDSILHTILL